MQNLSPEEMLAQMQADKDVQDVEPVVAKKVAQTGAERTRRYRAKKKLERE